MTRLRLEQARRAACCLAVFAFSTRLSAQTEPAPAAAYEVSQEAPKRFLITVVGDAATLGTFQRRVSSWFSDATAVDVQIAGAVEQADLLAASPTEVRAWIVPVADDRAVLTFSMVNPPAPPRHLVREVRLREGFDELGLERLASVTHSAFVALSQGGEGVEREQAERELGAVAVLPRAPTRVTEPVSSPSPAVSAAVPTPPRNAAKTHASATAATPPELRLIVGAGNGVRLRGDEGIGYGPSLALGVQATRPRFGFDVQASALYLFRSTFEAPPFRAAVQTTALRAALGIEPQLRAAWTLRVSIGLGVDLARISASVNGASDTGRRARPRADGTQWRSAGELTIGVWRRGEPFDFGLFVHGNVAFEDVRYSADTGAGDVLLARPWLFQPGFSLQGRFRGAP